MKWDSHDPNEALQRKVTFLPKWLPKSNKENKVEERAYLNMSFRFHLEQEANALSDLLLQNKYLLFSVNFIVSDS